MGAKILKFQVCHIKNMHEGVLMLPALVRARRTNGEFKAFVDSPSPLAEGMGLSIEPVCWASFDCQSWLGHTSPGACEAEEGLEDFH